MMYWYFSQINHEPKQRLLRHGAVVFYVYLFFVTYLYILSWLYKLSIFVGMEDELCSLDIFKDLGCQYFFINKFMLFFTEYNLGKFKKIMV